MNNVSKDETKNFIISKTQITWNSGARIQSLKFEGDTLVFETKDNTRKLYYKNKHRFTVPDNNKYRIELKELDPDRIHLTDENHLLLYVKEERELIKHEYIDYHFKPTKILRRPQLYAPTKTSTQYYLSIETYNSSLDSPKCVKAFKHLIALCGGSGELF